SALQAALVNARFSGLSSGLATLVTGLMLAAVVVLAALRTLDGPLSLGVLIAVVGVARYVMGMLQGLSGAPEVWAGMSTSARRVRDLYSDLGRTVDDPALSLDVLTTRRDERGGTGTGRRGAAGGLHLPQLSVADGEIIALACADAEDADAVIDAVRGRG